MQNHRSRKPEGRHGKDRHDAQPGRRSRAEGQADTPRGHLLSRKVPHSTVQDIITTPP